MIIAAITQLKALNIQASMAFERMTSADTDHRYSALPTELSSQLGAGIRRENIESFIYSFTNKCKVICL